MKKNEKEVKEQPFDYRDIKTVEDAHRKTGIKQLSLEDLQCVAEEFRAAVLAVHNLFVVFKAINNGWVADYTNFNQTKYFPWQKVNSSGSGFVFSLSAYPYDLTLSRVGSRLCTDTSEKALYVGEQFAAEYEKFML